MASEEWHSRITEQLGGKENYGRGIDPNPFSDAMHERKRRADYAILRNELSHKIYKIGEPRFVTGMETCEVMESLISMTDSRNILEVGMCTGMATLHFLRAIVGKEGAKVTSVDARPAHDREFFESPELSPWFRFIEGWSPEVLDKLSGEKFQFVFVDSQHDVQSTQREFDALLKITQPGSIICFHDVPAWQTPSHPGPPPVRVWLEEMVRDNRLQGFCLPSCHQADCEMEYGTGYDLRLNPGLAIMVRP